MDRLRGRRGREPDARPRSRRGARYWRRRSSSTPSSSASRSGAPASASRRTSVAREPAPELTHLGGVALPGLRFGRHARYPSARARSSTIGAGGPDGASILVVEDDAALRMVCRVTLELERFRRPRGRRRSTRRARRSPRSGPRSSFSTCIWAATASDALLDELRGGGDPGRDRQRHVPSSTSTPAGRARCSASRSTRPSSSRPPAPRASASVGAVTLATVRSPAEYDERARAATCSSAPRRRVPCASARRRPPSRPRSCGATPTSSAASSSRRSPRPSGAAAASERELPLPSAQDLRVGARLGGARRAPGRAREPAARGAGRASTGEEMPLRTAQAQLAVLDSYARARRARRAPGRVQRRVQPRPAGAARRRRGARGRALGDRRPGRAQRGGEGDLAARALARPPARERGRRASATRRCASAGSRGCSGPSATRCRRASTPPTCAGSRRSPRPTRRSARPRSACATLSELGFDLAASTNIKLDLDDRPQKAPRACVIPSDPPRDRPPHHPRPGRAPRLPGVPARGGPRAPLRRRRSRRCRCRSAGSRATMR